MNTQNTNNNQVIRITELAKLNDDERRENMININNIQEPVRVTERAKRSNTESMENSRIIKRAPIQNLPRRTTGISVSETEIPEHKPIQRRQSLSKKRENARDFLRKSLPLLIISIVMLISSLCITLKVTWIGIQLWGISFDISQMNEDTDVHHWNERVQKGYAEDIADRNALINSSDDLTSFVSRHSNLVRIPFWGFTVIMLVLSIWSIKFLLPQVLKRTFFLYRTRNHK